MRKFIFGLIGIIMLSGGSSLAMAQAIKAPPDMPTCVSSGWNSVGYQCFRKRDGKVCTMVSTNNGRGVWDCK
jgi:hypothetical protein